MARPYRRRKGKSGPFVGNYRVAVNGRDINLGTKDAQEAMARAKLAVKGKWPPEEAAAAAAVAALDPAQDDSRSEREGSGAPPAEDPIKAAPPSSGPEPKHPVAPEAAPASSPGPAEPLEVAAAAAAAAATEPERTAEQLEAEEKTRREVDTELAAVMGELTGGQTTGGEFLDQVCDGLAAAILWAERKGMELGWKWAISKRTGKQLVTQQPESDDMSRRAVRVGLKGIAVVHFPDLASKLTPGTAIAVGLAMGAVGAVVGGKLVELDKDGKVVNEVAVAEVMARGQQQQQQQQSAPPA